jgi:hypothetical protein
MKGRLGFFDLDDIIATALMTPPRELTPADDDFVVVQPKC